MHLVLTASTCMYWNSNMSTMCTWFLQQVCTGIATCQPCAPGSYSKYVLIMHSNRFPLPPSLSSLSSLPPSLSIPPSPSHSDTGSFLCTVCEAGSAQKLNGSTSCSICAAGTCIIHDCTCTCDVRVTAQLV